MSKPGRTGRQVRRSRRIALLVGLGAISTAAARADIDAAAEPGLSPTVALGEAVIRNDDGRLFLSEGGGEFRPLELGDTAAAQRLMALLRQADAAGNGISLRPTILAGDGGDGFHWVPSEKPTPQNSASKTRRRVRLLPERKAPVDPPLDDHGAKG